MYLSRIAIDLNRRETIRALSNLQIMHGLIERSFSGKRRRRLWRLDEVEGQKYILLVSEDRPDLKGMYEEIGLLSESPEEETASKDYNRFLEHLDKGQVWQFRLCANPVHAVRPAKGEPGARGVVRAHVTVEHQLKWLLDRQENMGVNIIESTVRIVNRRWHRFRKNSKHEVSIRSVTYEGLLEINDADKLKRVMTEGIGRAKAYGCGMLTLVKPPVT